MVKFPPIRPPGARGFPLLPRTLDLESILQGAQEVAIAHNGRIYRLRKTRNGKLILT